MTINPRDIEHIFERLRSGVVPERGLEAFAVGIDRSRAEIQRQLELAGNNEGVFKFLRGGYGCGKTFLARLAIADAQERNFATSFVVVSDNDLHFHRFGTWKIELSEKSVVRFAHVRDDHRPRCVLSDDLWW